MRVLLVEPYGDHMGHYGLFAAHTAQEMARLGHEVTLLTGIHFEPSKYLQGNADFQVISLDLKEFYSGDPRRKWARLRMFLDRLGLIWINAVTLWQLHPLISRSRFDFVHVLDWEPLSTFAVLNWRRALRGRQLPPLSVHLNPVDFSWAKHGKYIIKGIYILLAKRAIRDVFSRHCAMVSLQGEWHKQRILDNLLADCRPLPPMIVVRPGTAIPTDTIPRQAARSQLDLDDSSVVFLFFGVLMKHKGLELLLQAAAALPPGAKVLIAGGAYNWTAESIAEQIRRLQCGDRVLAHVRYIPNEQVGVYMSAADAVVLPYHAKNYAGGYGPVVVAAGYGKPLIVSDIGEMGVLVRKYRCGYAVVPEDPNTLRDAMLHFLSLSPLETQAMGRGARRMADEHTFTRAAEILTESFARCNHSAGSTT